MDNIIVISLFPLLGVIISVTLTFIMNKYQNKIELIKIYSEFIGELHFRKLEAYLKIYELVSGFIKIIRRKGILYEELLEFYKKYSKLDSKSGLLFSHTTSSSSQLIEKIGEILICREKYVYSENFKEDLLEKLRNVETTMKLELGVYSIQDPTAIIKKFNIPERKRKDLEKIIKRKIDI
jgi:hypothetical protein